VREANAKWAKAALDAATGPLGALAVRTAGDLARVPPLKLLMFQALKEASAAARAAGHPLSYERLKVEAIRDCLAAPDKPNPMLQALRRGRKTDIEAVAGPFLRAARKGRVQVPVLESLHRFVKRLERELRK